jgi:hypothetical protein
MSASTEVISGLNPSRSGGWSLWTGQIAAILRLEVRKNFIGKRAFLIYLLAAVSSSVDGGVVGRDQLAASPQQQHR